MPGSRMLNPEEVEVHYILPAVRRELAVCMKEQGLEQREIAQRIGVTEPAVSQYLNQKRACFVEFNKTLQTAIHGAAERIQNQKQLLSETRKLLKLALSEQITCDVHKKVASDIPSDCKICFE